MGIFYNSKSYAEFPQINFNNVVKNHELSRLMDCYNYQKRLGKSDEEIALLLGKTQNETAIIRVLSQLRGNSKNVSKTEISRDDSERIFILAESGADLPFICNLTGYPSDLILTTLRESFLNYRIPDPQRLSSSDWQAVESLVFLLKTPEDIARITGVDTGLIKQMTKEILDSYQSHRQRGATLCLDDKIVLEILYLQGVSNRKIARKLNCSPSTIGNELRRADREYSAYQRQKEQQLRYHCPRDFKKLKTAAGFIDGTVNAVLNGEFSVEGYYYYNRTHPQAEFFNQVMVSPPTFYNYVRKGLVPLASEDLPKGLKTPKQSPGFQTRENKKSLGPSVDEMPDLGYLGDRVKAFNWEMDTLLGSNKKEPCILTFRERRTNFSVALLIEQKNSGSVNAAFSGLIEKAGDLAGSLFKTVVTDNGSEFARLNEIPVVSENIFFAHPSTPTDKPNVERFNQQLREFFPKGNSMAHLTDFEVRTAADKINNRPSKIFDWATPEELFLIELKRLISSSKLESAGKLCDL